MFVQNVDFQVLTAAEQKEINGGIVCGGLCVGVIATVAFAAGSAFVVGVYNGYKNAEQQAESN